MTLVFGAFLIAHGLAHLLYVGQSLRLFELRPGLTWPAGSWAFSWLPGDSGARLAAACINALLTAAFVASGVALIFGQAWWQPAALSASGVSAVAIVLMWDGRRRELDAQGAYAILISAAILVAVLVFHWPDVAR